MTRKYTFRNPQARLESVMAEIQRLETARAKRDQKIERLRTRAEWLTDQIVSPTLETVTPESAA